MVLSLMVCQDDDDGQLTHIIHATGAGHSPCLASSLGTTVTSPCTPGYDLSVTELVLGVLGLTHTITSCLDPGHRSFVLGDTASLAPEPQLVGWP
jgi:hypothetical protein